MLDYTKCIIEKIAAHHVGNKTEAEEGLSDNGGEGLILSKDLLDITGAPLRELLLRFFLKPFNVPEYYAFTFSNEDFTMNPVYKFATEVFDNIRSFHKNSVDIAKLLYEVSTHPQIKPGDLFVAYFTGVSIEDYTTDAIGIFKSESKQPFLKLDGAEGDFILQYEDGINIEKLDKACLILNTDKDSGYKVCMIDKANKSMEAQYWKDDFLKLKPCSDNYHHTKEFMTITKNFVTEQMPEDFEVSKADQIDFLNRSVDYFKRHEIFDKREFETEVLQDTGIIKSFRKFDTDYRANNDIEVSDSFDISTQAVKKQARVFKSVLKLDRNFHIYIHGNRDLIEQGVDKDGRKFYKIYYNNEA